MSYNVIRTYHDEADAQKMFFLSDEHSGFGLLFRVFPRPTCDRFVGGKTSKSRRFKGTKKINK